MNDLRRALAPISERGWAAIEAEAKQTLQHVLTARRLVDFKGPLGWDASAINTGRVRPLGAEPVLGVHAALRIVQPLMELRADFQVSREALDDLDRGASDSHLDGVREAARHIAAAEDTLVFNGGVEPGIQGIVPATSHAPLHISDDYDAYPGLVAQGLELLHDAGVEGPYSLALGPRCYVGLLQAAGPGGYPLINRVGKMVDIVRAPTIEGALLVSKRGGDFELSVGRDISIGYHAHSADSVQLYLVESLTFRVLAPEAAVSLIYG